MGPPTRTPIQSDGPGIEQTTSKEALENTGWGKGGLADVRNQTQSLFVYYLLITVLFSMRTTANLRLPHIV